MNKRLLIVLLLGFSSGLPLALITSTLQAWFADAGMPVMATGMLSLVGFPYVYRMLWGPILDRYCLFSLGKRRSWILSTQILLLLGFNLMSWLSPTSSPHLMGGLAFILASVSATQDMAIDAHRTEYLPLPQHGIGASLGVMGYRLALLVSGGLALIMAQHLGWASTYRVMGGLMMLGLIATILSPEPSSLVVERLNFKSACLAPIRDLLTRPHLFSLLMFIFFYKIGESFTTSTSGVMMPFLIQGLGFSLDTIAYVNKIIGVGSIIFGGVVAGILLMRWSLYRALFVFGLFQALTNALFIVLAKVGAQLPLFILAVVSDNFAAGMGSIALVALFMKLVNQRFTAAQFSILVGLSTLPRIVSGPMGAMLQTAFGWAGLYQVAFVMAFIFIPFLIKIRSMVMVDSEHHDDVDGLSVNLKKHASYLALFLRRLFPITGYIKLKQRVSSWFEMK